MALTTRARSSLATSETRDQTHDRRFEFVLTFDRDLVIDVAATLISRVSVSPVPASHAQAEALGSENRGRDAKSQRWQRSLCIGRATNGTSFTSRGSGRRARMHLAYRSVVTSLAGR